MKKINYFNKIRTLSIKIGLILTFGCLFTCKRQDDWLNVKSNNALITPSTIADYQAILDRSATMNANYPALGLTGTDNLYLPDVNFGTVSSGEVNLYLWTQAPFAGLSAGSVPDWDSSYQIVENANIVLDGIKNITSNVSSQNQYNNVEGSALFFRAYAFYNIAQIFCKPYVTTTASTDLGIPLRLTSDVNIKSVRATVQQTYNQIISDLLNAIALLPQTPLNLMRPSQNAANALLAKVYLNVGDYTNAALYANNTLTTLPTFNSLYDFNRFPTNTYNNSTRAFPTTFSAINSNNFSEIIFWATAIQYPSISSGGTSGYCDTTFYKTYNNNDLRKVILFQQLTNGNHTFKGSYSYSGVFAGIAVDEVYLIRAESYARTGNAVAAITDINTLLSKRYVTGTFTPYSATTPDNALAIVLQERRKELPFTGQIRWEDLRRLNQDSRFAITLKRISNGVTYTLLPNDARYVLPIPDYEIQLSGLQQNPR